MNEIKLEKRYPHSRTEDITDAFMRGYVKGKADEKRWWSEHCAKCNDADRPQGEWIGGRVGHSPGYTCSICGYGVQPWNNTNYCPNCGARMKGAGYE